MSNASLLSNFNVFVSYAQHDEGHAVTLAKKLRELGATVNCWADSKVPGERAWGTIQGWIGEADAVVAVISKTTLEVSAAVSQEIGYATASRKVVVPLLEPGVPASKLAMIAELTHITWDGNTLEEATEKLQPVLSALSKSKQFKALLFFGALGALGLYLLPGGKK